MCLFCDLSKDPDKRFTVYEDDIFYSIFDVHPVTPGHALVIPKRHVVSLFDLTEEEWASLRHAAKKTTEEIKTTNFENLYTRMKERAVTSKSPRFCNAMLNHRNLLTSPGDFNIGSNEGERAGRTVNHLHLQIIPRYKDDVPNPIGGIRNVIPGMGDYT